VKYSGKGLPQRVREQRRLSSPTSSTTWAAAARSSAFAGVPSFSRPFDRVEALRRTATTGRASIGTAAELQQTEAKLTELQTKRNDQTSLMLSARTGTEVKRFTAVESRARKELRETQHGLNVDIERLDSRLKAVQHCRRAAHRGGGRRLRAGVAPPPQIARLSADAAVARRLEFPMSRQRFALLIAVALVTIAAAFYVSTLRDAPHEAPGLALLPALPNDLNAVTAVTVRKGSATPTLTLHKAGQQWSVAERADYPADVSKLRQLLVIVARCQNRRGENRRPCALSAIGSRIRPMPEQPAPKSRC